MNRISWPLAERTAILEQCSLFAGLEPSEIETWAEEVLVRQYARDEHLFFQHDAGEGFYIVASGTLKVYRLGTDGREQILHLFGKAEVVGEVPVFEGGQYPASAMAMAESTTLYLPRASFLRLGTEHPELLLNMLATLSKRLRKFVTIIDDLSLKEVSARLAKMILAEADGTAHCALRTTKATLAAQLGTIAETLSRTLKKLQQRGLIHVDGPHIEILDADGLQHIAEGAKL